MEQQTQTTTQQSSVPTQGGAPIASRPRNDGNRRPGGSGGYRGQGSGGSRGPRRGGPRGEKPRSEFDQKTLAVRRVTRVVAGGRRFAFSVAIVTGNKKGSVGVGIGKAGDTSQAIQKALADAKKSMITLSLTKTHSITAPSEAKNSSARVMIFPNNGRGLVAGSAVRTVLELAGVKDVTAKVFSPSKNKLNIARAALDALQMFAQKKGTPIVEVAPEEKQ